MHSSERNAPTEIADAAREIANPVSSQSPPRLAPSVRLLPFVIALWTLVHGPAVAEAPGQKPKAPTPGTPEASAIGRLPRPVAEMVDAILAAVHSGSIEDLRTAIEWNEMSPVFAPPEAQATNADDPVELLKKASTDGGGAQILAILADVLSVRPARQPLGRDFENNTVYVWPYLAERPLDALTPAEKVDLYRIVPVQEIEAMRAAGRWTWYRLVIGADGTWHSFMPHR